jgi:hypothetical protein
MGLLSSGVGAADSAKHAFPWTPGSQVDGWKRR